MQVHLVPLVQLVMMVLQGYKALKVRLVQLDLLVLQLEVYQDLKESKEIWDTEVTTIVVLRENQEMLVIEVSY